MYPFPPATQLTLVCTFKVYIRSQGKAREEYSTSVLVKMRERKYTDALQYRSHIQNVMIKQKTGDYGKVNGKLHACFFSRKREEMKRKGGSVQD